MRTPTLLWLPLAWFATAVMPAALLATAQQQQAPQQQSAPSQDPGSVADAARGSRALVDGSGSRRIYTEEDLSALRGTVSVVGEDRSVPAAADTPGALAKPAAAGETNPVIKNEAYWRGRYRTLRQQIDLLDKYIAFKQREIKHYGANGESTDLSKQTCTRNLAGQVTCIAPVVDRVDQLHALESKKADLLKQVEELQDEARIAGAEPGWVR